jgi:transcriptional regulator with XRE-family HTH domain
MGLSSQDASDSRAPTVSTPLGGNLSNGGTLSTPTNPYSAEAEPIVAGYSEPSPLESQVQHSVQVHDGDFTEIGKGLRDGPVITELVSSQSVAESHAVTHEANSKEHSSEGQIDQINDPQVTSPPSASKCEGRLLHRLREARISQGISERTMCRRLGIDTKTLRAIECPKSDLRLTQLLEFQEALDLPISELLESEQARALEVQHRAKLVKIMKTVVSLRDSNLPQRSMRLAEMLSQQLIELMPELAQVSGWPEFGSRRNQDSVARILSNEINTSQIKLNE